MRNALLFVTIYRGPVGVYLYRRDPSLLIGISETLRFGLVSVRLFTVSAKPFHIGETLHFGSVSVRSFTLDPVSIGIGWNLWIGIGCDLWILGIDWHRLEPLDSCDLWKPVVSISISWNLLDRCQVYGFLVLSELNFKGQQLFG
ncbi:unnamed protein product [Rhizophagus irregularis]|nr:unnamed protein product [Rhizophagus irregularis]